MATTAKEIETFIEICESHDVSRKEAFARIGRKIAKDLARLLSLPEGSYDVRYNKAGIAVMGDLRLHSEGLYMTFEPSYSGLGFMYRTCKGRKDYTGGANQWARHQELRDLPGFADKIEAFLEREARSHQPTRG